MSLTDAALQCHFTIPSELYYKGATSMTLETQLRKYECKHANENNTVPININFRNNAKLALVLYV